MSSLGALPDGAELEIVGDDATAAASPLYAALDLGTNNCRLLIARRSGAEGMRIVDAYSRIVRLGEGLAQTGRLNETAIQRTLDALLVCREKIERRHVAHARLIATEACRTAANGQDFVERAHAETGLKLEVINRATEARLAALGCGALADPYADNALLFDIGGGSTEVVWLGARESWRKPQRPIILWTSIELGVVTLAERFGGRHVDSALYEAMVEAFAKALSPFVAQTRALKPCSRFHLLGASGTVTTIAGVFLDLANYERRRVDGLWLTSGEVDSTIEKLRRLSFEQRAANGCIGPERADLVLPGCAILDAIRRSFPADRLRVADRGLREGVLIELMRERRAAQGAKS